MKVGGMVERRDQVRTTFFSFFSFIATTFFTRWSSLNGPFLRDLLIAIEILYRFFDLRFTIHLSVRLLLRVLYPRVGCPHGVTGWRPPEVFPSPPPCG